MRWCRSCRIGIVDHGSCEIADWLMMQDCGFLRVTPCPDSPRSHTYAMCCKRSSGLLGHRRRMSSTREATIHTFVSACIRGARTAYTAFRGPTHVPAGPILEFDSVGRNRFLAHDRSPSPLHHPPHTMSRCGECLSELTDETHEHMNQHLYFHERMHTQVVSDCKFKYCRYPDGSKIRNCFCREESSSGQ